MCLTLSCNFNVIPMTTCKVINFLSVQFSSQQSVTFANGLAVFSIPVFCQPILSTSKLHLDKSFFHGEMTLYFYWICFCQKIINSCGRWNHYYECINYCFKFRVRVERETHSNFSCTSFTCTKNWSWVQFWILFLNRPHLDVVGHHRKERGFVVG